MALCISDWLRYSARHFTPKTIKHYGECIRVFDKFLSDQSASLHTQSIEAYIDHRLAAGAKHRTVNANVTAIRSYCNWREEKFGEPNPTTAIKTLREDPPNQRVLSEEEYFTVLSVSTGEDRDTIAFLGNTGLRAGPAHTKQL
jgi:site-specific recombinase XerD